MHLFKPAHWLFISRVRVGPTFDSIFLCFCVVVELSRRNSEDNGENIPLAKKSVVILKKELAQKTEALNKALKRENELKVSWL